MASSSSSPKLKIGINGFGPFAQFLTRTMLKQGHSLAAASRSDYSRLCSQLGIHFFRDVGDMIESDVDVVLLSTSIVSVAGVVRSIPFERLGRRPPPLFVDVLSVKEYPRDLLLQFLPEEADILCTHPMFGPESGKDGWQGLSLVYDKVRIRNLDICQRFLDIFKAEGCKMLEMSCVAHDKVAARTQFLTHTIGRILAEMEIESTPMDTKGFQSLIHLRDNTVKDSFDLYRGLFEYNKFAEAELEKLELAMQDLRRKLSG